MLPSEPEVGTSCASKNYSQTCSNNYMHQQPQSTHPFTRVSNVKLPALSIKRLRFDHPVERSSKTGFTLCKKGTELEKERNFKENEL